MVACRRQVQPSEVDGSTRFPDLTGVGAAVDRWFEVAAQAIVHVSCSS
jgi:hypothetical protein